MDSVVVVERFFLSCLAHASYMIFSGGVAAVIDPQRDVELYLTAAKKTGARISHVIETHLHADFVSGHRELAERTGATIYLGAGSGAVFDHVEVSDSKEVRFGAAHLRFMQTPGHTLESICVLLNDLSDAAKPAVLFTGDTLFVGDVGRPDLSPSHTPPQLAALLYRSLHDKLLKLPDDTQVYPAHGAGSLCGKSMSADAFSTIGRERLFNYALQAKSEAEFVHLLTDNLPPRPEYFARDAELNRAGAAPIAGLPTLTPLEPREMQEAIRNGAVALDTRPPAQFAAGHVPGSVNIALSGQFASWTARILGLNTPVILVAEDGDKLYESQLRLARVGAERIAGFVAGGMTQWQRTGHEVATLPQVSADELAALLHNANPPTVLDVREPGEVADTAIVGSVRIPLGQLSKRTSELATYGSYAVHCKSGYRSSIACGLLLRAGIAHVANVSGGIDAWKSAGLPVVSEQAQAVATKA